ncbi:hypothetical protein CROQUDRAFT_664721 [Cronartium quercuum f. sp. fusiforme G11]|uniref:YDG domain-containing protein n=1 Tax=Cronartium quercuum f. sp. fusiforme G11 TaxID=708437 RepID=A0A9P6NBH4_9BASI|nr:hypothetical protein CROQUDRAFT_664721 [Cronartium quercuum f. sp. fusiforme G11]
MQPTLNSTLTSTSTNYLVKTSIPRKTQTLNRKKRPNPKCHSHIRGVVPGQFFKDRFQLSQAGVHAPLQSGISGLAQRGGTESVVLNGGYPSGDSGDIIWYKGFFGFKSPITGKPTKKMSIDQNLKGSDNKSLTASLKTKNPIRVIRGSSFKNSPWAPEIGYRYDGLYIVTRQAKARDPSGETDFYCYIWRMERIIEDDGYIIPIKEGMEVDACERSRLGKARKDREDLDDLESLSKSNQNHQPLKINSSSSIKRVRDQESSKALVPNSKPLPKFKKIEKNKENVSVGISRSRCFEPTKLTTAKQIITSSENFLARKSPI